MVKARRAAPIVIGGVSVGLNEERTFQLQATALPTHTELSLPVHVVRGKTPGPCLLITAAVHGDEINGVEIIRRITSRPLRKRLRGTLIAVPVVNVYGFVSRSRYLSDRRDLNRCFPGSNAGSVASRLAHRFMEEIFCHATHAVDLHTGAIHRSNLPQVRIDPRAREAERLGRAFGVPVILRAPVIDGSLRAAAHRLGVPMLVYEGGEALRFGEFPIRAGVRGVLSVMRALEMLPPVPSPKDVNPPVLARRSSWVRSPESGVLRTMVKLGARVGKGDTLGVVGGPFGANDTKVLAPAAGILIGCANLPLVHEGDALFHIAYVDRLSRVAARVVAFSEEMANQDVDAFS